MSAVATSETLPVTFAPFFAGQERALQLIHDGAPLEAILTVLVQALEAAFDKRVVGAILIVDTGGRRLRHGAAPSLPAIYNRAVDGIEIGPYGTCCDAAHRNVVVVTPDIEHDPGWAKLKDYPLAIRLRAAWSLPIRAGDGRVLGTFGTYFHECRRPTDTEVELVSLLTRTAALAIEKRPADVPACLPSPAPAVQWVSV